VGVSAHDALRADGYAWTLELTMRDDDFDAQGHLNNAAIARHFNDLRVAYVQARLGVPWLDWLRTSGSVVVAREVHLLYETEGYPHESFTGATRVLRRDGRAGIIEQRVVETGSGRPVARAWIVQLLAREGRAVDWPDFYWDLVAAAEGHAIAQRDRPRDGAARSPWGPPA
jgi:acyl-CoA thioesterase FadM